MSRLKLILSILLMLFLLLVAIFLPSKLREQKETPDPEAQEEAATQEERTQPEELTEMDFLSFEELSQFFSSAQTASLKEQFPLYLTLIGRTDITSAEYLPDETGYPDTTTVELVVKGRIPCAFLLVFVCWHCSSLLTAHPAVRRIFPRSSACSPVREW